MVDEIVVTKRLIGSLIVIAVMVAALIFIKQVLIKKVAYQSRHNHKNTSQGLLFNLLQYVVIILAVFAILSVNGINVTGMLASLGIVATIVGLSLQDTFKDLFAGINIYGNNFYKVGDFVRYNGEVCEVKFFNARVTKFSSIVSGSTYTVANSCITNIEKLKLYTSYTFMFDYDVDAKKVNHALDILVEKLKAHPDCKDSWHLSIVDINYKGVTYFVKIVADPEKQMGVKAACARWAYDEFKKLGIAPIFENDRDIVVSDKKRFYREANREIPAQKVIKEVKKKAKKASK